MAKYENIRALAKKQLQAVTESSDRWKAFLRTAAIAYNYSFPNQLLIHEQSPTATAVADIAYWNNNAGRWVKRGAHGIAVFDTRANSSRLRYLFDISAISKSMTRSITGCIFPFTTISLPRASTSCAPAASWRSSPPAAHWTKRMTVPASTLPSAATLSVRCACPTMRSRAAALKL